MDSKRFWRISARVGLVAVAAAVVAVVGSTEVAVAVPSTPAYSSSTCLNSACVWNGGTGGFSIGGPGVSISSLTTGGWQPSAVIQQRVLSILSQAGGVLPRYETVPALQTITLGSGPLNYGWKIGSTQNTKWLHLHSAALDRSGVSAAVTSVFLTFLSQDLPYRTAGATGCYVNSDGTCGPRLPTGWYVEGSDPSCSVSGSPMVAAYNIPSGFSQSCWGTASLAVTRTPVARRHSPG